MEDVEDLVERIVLEAESDRLYVEDLVERMGRS